MAGPLMAAMGAGGGPPGTVPPLGGAATSLGGAGGEGTRAAGTVTLVTGSGGLQALMGPSGGGPPVRQSVAVAQSVLGPLEPMLQINSRLDPFPDDVSIAGSNMGKRIGIIFFLGFITLSE